MRQMKFIPASIELRLWSRRFLFAVIMSAFPLVLVGDEMPTSPKGEQISILIPPSPPPQNLRRTLGPGDFDSSDRVLINAPAYDWTYGCGPTTGGILAAYYDRVGEMENLYVSGNPEIPSICPKDAKTAREYWGKTLEADSPFIASKAGVNGRKAKGHVDDYWHAIDSEIDPYYGNWTAHADDSIADFTGTSDFHRHGMGDGWTNVMMNSFGYKHVQPLDETDLVSGIVNYFKYRGYTIREHYAQLTQNPDSLIPLFDSFKLKRYQSEIEAGRPVILFFTGHVVLGIGYRVDTETVYVCDTWGGIRKAEWNGKLDETDLDMIGAAVIRPDSVPVLDPSVALLEEWPVPPEPGSSTIIAIRKVRRFLIRANDSASRVAIVMEPGPEITADQIAKTTLLRIAGLPIRLNPWERPSPIAAKTLLGSKGFISCKPGIINIQLFDIEKMLRYIDKEREIIPIELVDEAGNVVFQLLYERKRINIAVN
jgi:hypothetical protein